MLDVYADGVILRKVINLRDKNRTEQIYEKIFDFLNRSCHLHVNKLHVRDINNIPKYHYLNLFTQGKGDLGKMTPMDFERTELEQAKPWSVFLLEKSEQKSLFDNQKHFNADEHNFIEKLSKLLFLIKNQSTSFIILPSESTTEYLETKDANIFHGWQSLEGDNLLQLTDVVIIDKYFLAPAYHGNLKAYIDECLFPLFRVLRSKTNLESLNITVFTMENDKSRYSAQALYDEINYHPDFCNLGIEVGFALRKKTSLGIHKRYIITNYQGMNPGLSIHGFTYSRVLGDQDDFEIFPYSIRPEKHGNDLNLLRNLASDVRKGRFSLIGELNNKLITESA